MKRDSNRKLIVLSLTVLFLFSFMIDGSQKESQKGKKIDFDDILKTGPKWQQNYRFFRAHQDYIELLKSKTAEGNLKVDVYLGLWCRDSEKNVPKFIRLIQALEHDNIKVNYYTVERKPNKSVKYFIEHLKIERVPTFIVYRDNKEIGRIIENPTKSLIEDFLEIVF
jgi:hypothetical protein